MITRTKWLPAIALLAISVSPVGAQNDKGAGQATKPPPVVQSFVAIGPTNDADLERLRAKLEKAAGVQSIEIRKTVNGAYLTVKGDVLYTVLDSAANPLGYSVQLTPARFFAAKGSSGVDELAALRSALQKAPGVDRVAMSPVENGAAVRISGLAEYKSLVATAKTAGFDLQQLSSFAASGSSEEKNLGRLRTALAKVTGVEQVEMHAMIGGATLLIHGAISNPAIAKEGRTAGYDIWPLSNAANPSAEYRIAGAEDEVKRQKLSDLVRGIEGIDEFQINDGTDGPRLVVSGERLKTDRIAAAAAEAGFKLTMIENVALPTLTPKAGRGTPADYENAIVEDPIKPGEPAPSFSLLSNDGKNQINLSDFRDKKPVVLLFGSCT